MHQRRCFSLGVAAWVAWPAVLFGLPASAGTRDFVVDTKASKVTVHVGRAGLFKLAGHEHEVEVPLRDGRISADPQDASRATLAFSVATAALRVTGQGEPADDVPEVLKRMLGKDVLDALVYPEIVFRSSAVGARPAEGGGWDVTVVGDLSLHGSTRRITLPAQVKIEGDSLHASGALDLRQTEFGVRPVSVGGVVKVKDELRIEWDVVAHAAGGSGAAAGTGR